MYVCMNVLCLFRGLISYRVFVMEDMNRVSSGCHGNGLCFDWRETLQTGGEMVGCGGTIPPPLTTPV